MTRRDFPNEMTIEIKCGDFITGQFVRRTSQTRRANMLDIEVCITAVLLQLLCKNDYERTSVVVKVSLFS